MGFRVKVMPGVHVRVSSRGVRTSVGPRVARVHVGGGRSGISTGLGPVSYYTSLGTGSSSYRSGSRSGSGASRGSYVRAYGPTPAQQAKAQAAHELENRIKYLTEAHLQTFKPILPRKIDSSGGPDFNSILAHYVGHCTKDIRPWQRKRLAEAKQQAKAYADAEYATELEDFKKFLDEERQKGATELALLTNNDPDTVLAILTEAFGDNEAKAAVVAVEQDAATLVVAMPDQDILPSHNWGLTSAGNVSIRKMTASDRSTYYYDFVGSQLLATFKEAFAVAPGLGKITAVVVRTPHFETLVGKTEVLGYVTLTRRQMSNLHGSVSSPFGILFDYAEEVTFNINSKFHFEKLNLTAEPDIQVLVNQLNLID